MELRDYFAAHVAAALAQKMERPETIAARAYDLADALVRERVRRPLELGLESELPPEAFFDDDARFFQPDAIEPHFAEIGLLDEPAPMSERDDEPSWMERADRPEWEADAKPVLDVRPSERPGLARTAPQIAAEEKLRKSGG